MSAHEWWASKASTSGVQLSTFVRAMRVQEQLVTTLVANKEIKVAIEIHVAHINRVRNLIRF